jgi:hypothetical protein|tara:strand:- start:210 stop:482 length:273 start_codon:yes stop_codon:yes gene_type:complete
VKETSAIDVSLSHQTLSAGVTHSALERRKTPATIIQSTQLAAMNGKSGARGLTRGTSAKVADAVKQSPTATAKFRNVMIRAKLTNPSPSE